MSSERKGLADWDEESIRYLFEESDEITRSLLSYVAQTENARGVRLQQVGRDLELQGYVPKLLKALERRTRREFGKVPPVKTDRSSETRGIPVLTMDEDVAALIRAAALSNDRRELDEGEV